MGVDVTFFHELERLWGWDVRGEGGVGSNGACTDCVLGMWETGGEEGPERGRSKVARKGWG